MAALSYDRTRVLREIDTLADVVGISQLEGQVPSKDQLEELDSTIRSAARFLADLRELRLRNPDRTELTD